MTKAQKRVYDAAMRRYSVWRKQFPMLDAQIVAGSNSISSGKIGADLVRACAAARKSAKKGKR